MACVAACNTMAGSASQSTARLRVLPSRRLRTQAGRRRSDRPARRAGERSIRTCVRVWHTVGRTRTARVMGPPGLALYLAPLRLAPHPMFESLTQRLSGTMQRLRGRGRLTEENIREAAARSAHRPARSRRRACRWCMALIERIKVRAVGQEVLTSLTPGPGADQGRARRAGRGDGFAGQRAQPQRAGAGDHPDGGPAGRGQDHHGRQARQAPEGTAQEEGDGGQLRRLSSGRDRAAGRRWRSRSTCCSSRQRCVAEAGRHRPRRDRRCAQDASSTC